jgi:hypothetical protein
VPPLILVAVAIVQIVLAKTSGLTAWKGGGFGMFSTLDNAPFRTIRIFVEAPGRAEEIQVAPSLEDQFFRTVALPSELMLRRLAQATVDRERRKQRPVTLVRLELWREEFSTVGLEAVQTQVRSYEQRFEP